MLSVVVPTCNRAAKLESALADLLRSAEAFGQPCEIVVVDNASTDRTKEVIHDFAKRSAGLVKYVWEPRRGASHARNAGWKAASGDPIAFTDDDCRVAEDWLSKIAAKFAEDAALDMLGGRIELYDPGHRPVSIRTYDEIVEYRDPNHDLTMIAGANFAVRRRAAEALGGFDARLGPGSRHELTSEDIEYIYRAYKLGQRIVYFPDIVIRHDHGRNTDADIQRITKIYTRGRGALAAKHILRGDKEAMRLAYWHLHSMWHDRKKARRAGRSGVDEFAEIRDYCIGLFLGAELTLLARAERS